MADHKYENAGYLGDAEDDTSEPEIQDLGFIVEDRDDRRVMLVDENRKRLENLDEGEEQEDDFVQTSMLAVDPDEGADDFTSPADLDTDGRLETTDISGQVAGIARGFGTSLPLDIGAGGFSVHDNPLMRPVGPDHPISNERLSDEALGLREVDEIGVDEELERLADQAAREAERR